jgi:hypothetical protein
MSNETEAGPSGASQAGGHSPDGDGLSSPLQARAPFLKNWSWQSVTDINRGSCERGRAQHGTNSETHGTSAKEWEKVHLETLSLLQTLDTLRAFHRRAPFLFFNGNTFASIGRDLAITLFDDLTHLRKAEVSSAFGHYIAGTLDRDSMIQIVEGLSEETVFKPGDRVKTFRGTLKGVVVRIQNDGRVLWRPDGSATELIAEPDSLLRLL